MNGKPINKKPTRIVTVIETPRSKERIMKIVFPFDKKDLELVKSIPGRKYFDEGNYVRYWTAPISREGINTLVEAGFSLPPELKSVIDPRPIVTVESIGDIPGLKMELYPYQKEGVAFIEATDGHALLADEMGLGKTAQTLAWLQLHPELRPAIIVCPASLKLNWDKEAHMWLTDPKTQILSGTNPNTKLIGEILIINYDILPNWGPVLSKIKPKC